MTMVFPVQPPARIGVLKPRTKQLFLWARIVPRSLAASEEGPDRAFQDGLMAFLSAFSGDLSRRDSWAGLWRRDLLAACSVDTQRLDTAHTVRPKKKLPRNANKIKCPRYGQSFTACPTGSGRVLSAWLEQRRKGRSGITACAAPITKVHGSAPRALRHEAVFFHLVVQRAAADAQLLSGFFLVTLSAFQSFGDGLPFPFFHGGKSFG